VADQITYRLHHRSKPSSKPNASRTSKMRKKSDLPFQSSNFVCEPCGDGSYGGEPLLSVGLAARKALNVLKYNWGNFSAALGLRVTGMGSAAAAPELISC
jgi:hypothetical protein